jgi:hypothetical protein
MKPIKILVTVALLAAALTAQASIETKTWPASDEAQQLVKDTIVVGFFATPWMAGWTEDALSLLNIHPATKPDIPDCLACTIAHPNMTSRTNEPEKGIYLISRQNS